MKLLVLVIASLISSAVLADTKFSLGGGFNFNTVKTEEDLGDNVDEGVSADLAIAGKVEVDMNEQWLFRTGLWLQEKTAKFEIEIGSFEGDLNYNTIYASVPLTVQYKASDSIGVFGGYIADVRINDYCDTDGDFDSCTIDEDSETIVHLATVGMAINASEKLNIELSWQQGLTDFVEDSLKVNTFQTMLFYKF